MRTSVAEVGAVLRAERGVIAVRQHPQLERSVQRLARAKLLTLILPGVYVADHSDLEVRIRAATVWLPAAVILGSAAARLTYWPSVAVSTITLGAPRRRAAPAGFVVVQDNLPPELILHAAGVRLGVPALTALDLGGPGIDHALLRRACTLRDMHQALAATPRRRGNRERRRLLHDSRDEPWSEAERLLHALLRAAHLSGWRANHGVYVNGRLYYLDGAFPAAKLAIEVDGYEVHSRRGQFERDREKWSDLTAAGWRTLHFTWSQLDQRPAWVIATIRAALAREF